MFKRERFLLRIWEMLRFLPGLILIWYFAGIFFLLNAFVWSSLYSRILYYSIRQSGISCNCGNTAIAVYKLTSIIIYRICGIKHSNVPHLRYIKIEEYFYTAAIAVQIKTKWQHIPQLRYMEIDVNFMKCLNSSKMHSFRKNSNTKDRTVQFFSADRIFWKWFSFNLKYFSSCESLVRLPTKAWRVN